MRPYLRRDSHLRTEGPVPRRGSGRSPVVATGGAHAEEVGNPHLREVWNPHSSGESGDLQMCVGNEGEGGGARDVCSTRLVTCPAGGHPTHLPTPAHLGPTLPVRV
eukprot:363248-Chlamydomonas_euryale.AAC.12